MKDAQPKMYDTFNFFVLEDLQYLNVFDRHIEI